MQSTSAENNKRIAKNTVALYIRTFITMIVSLFTSRVILNALGVDDYGINNVVGGIVSMFSIVTSSLAQAISRYITFELGKKDINRLRLIFSTSVNIQILMSLVMILLAETIGLWFLNNKMNIAPERMYAANWVFQFAVLSFVTSLISVPYNAAIIAHEHMKAFAYISIVEAGLKLGLAYMLCIIPFDKLIVYSFLMFFVAFLLRAIYGLYCKRHFEESSYHFVLDKSLLKEMLKFSGWNFIASTSYIFNTQGVNIISNMFFGVPVNAARGIAVQVEGVTKNFIANFTTAVKPQVIKSYSSGDKEYMSKLICNGTKYSFFMMLVISMPFFFEAEFILKLWLGLVPERAASFVRLAMVVSLVGLLGDILYTNVLAVGKLKKYMICETAITFLVFPLTYVAFTFRGIPEIPYVLFAVVYFVLIFIRLFFLREMEKFPVSYFFKSVLRVAFKVLLASIPIPLALFMVLDRNVLASVLIIFISICSTIISVMVVGIDSSERKAIMNFVLGKRKKMK